MNAVSLKKNGEILIETVEVSCSLAKRLKGLLGRSVLPDNHGMYIAPCNSIHTFFMKFDLDLIFLNRENQVVKIVRDVPPWRMVAGGIDAYSVIEVSTGWFSDECLSVGDDVEIDTP